MRESLKTIILMKKDIQEMAEKHQPDPELFYLTLISVIADIAMAHGLTLDEYLQSCANMYHVKSKPINEEIH